MLRRAGGAGVGRLVAAAAETSSCVSAATAAAAFSSTSGSSLSSSLRSGLRSALSRCAEPSGRAAASASAAAAGRQWRVAPWQQVRRQWGGGRPSSGGWTDRRGYEHFDGRGSFLSMRSRGTPDGRRAVRWLVIIGGAGTVVWVRSRQEVPYTGRMHAILVDPESEMEMGQQTFQQIVDEARMTGALLHPQHRACQAVRRVGTRVAQAATDGFGGGFQEHLHNLKWEFAVIRSNQVNAFVVPGGKVVVYTGLLNLIRNEDELASVLAHECAHVVARHAAERITQMGALELMRMVAYWGFGLPIPSGPLSAVFFLPNSRKQETEADVIGIQIMARACYAPEGMYTMFQKMGKAEEQQGGQYIPKFLRTHPLSSDRIQAIKKMMPLAEGLYETSGCEAMRGPLFAFRESIFRRVDWGTQET